MRALVWLSLALMLGAGASPAKADDQIPGTPAYRAFYGSFLEPSCCFTHGCCRRASPGEIEALDDRLTKFRVVASGQVINRTTWSPDGAFHICQCDWDGTSVTQRGPATNARCLAVPAPTG